jgi:hypothetical protein
VGDSSASREGDPQEERPTRVRKQTRNARLPHDWLLFGAKKGKHRAYMPHPATSALVETMSYWAFPSQDGHQGALLLLSDRRAIEKTELLSPSSCHSKAAGSHSSRKRLIEGIDPH